MAHHRSCQDGKKQNAWTQTGLLSITWNVLSDKLFSLNRSTVLWAYCCSLQDCYWTWLVTDWDLISWCCEKTPAHGDLRKEGLLWLRIWGYSLSLWEMHGTGVCSSRSPCTQSQKAKVNGGWSSALLSPENRASVHGVGNPHLGWAFLLQLSPTGNTLQTCPEMCSPNSQSSQFDNINHRRN